MEIQKKLKLGNNIYYVVVDLKYKKDNNGINKLCLKNFKNDYFDGGDFSLLIDDVEKKYDVEIAKNYDSNISLMADVLYLYDRIPYLSGIKDVYISDSDNLPYSIGYISREEIDRYIDNNDIKMNIIDD